MVVAGGWQQVVNHPPPATSQRPPATSLLPTLQLPLVADELPSRMPARSPRHVPRAFVEPAQPFVRRQHVASHRHRALGGAEFGNARQAPAPDAAAPLLRVDRQSVQVPRRRIGVSSRRWIVLPNRRRAQREGGDEPTGVMLGSNRSHHEKRTLGDIRLYTTAGVRLHPVVEAVRGKLQASRDEQLEDVVDISRQRGADVV